LKTSFVVLDNNYVAVPAAILSKGRIGGQIKAIDGQPRMWEINPGKPLHNDERVSFEERHPVLSRCVEWFRSNEQNFRDTGGKRADFVFTYTTYTLYELLRKYVCVDDQ
jgi:hypothetical protein